MRAVLTTPGVFHHFALARELAARGELECIYTGFPWLRVEREGIARDRVRTFPVLAPLAIVLDRRFQVPSALRHHISTATAVTFDRYCAETLPPCDILIAASGSGLRTGMAAQAEGALYLCDRGGSHFRYQTRILAEEYARWGAPVDNAQPAAMAREESEYAAADAILVPSAFSHRSFVEMGVPAAKLHTVVLAADVTRFYPVGEPSLDGPADEFTVVYAGQVSFRKGLPYLLEAFARLRHPHKRLRLVGQVEDRIRPYLKTAPLEHVVFEGPKPLAEVRRIMSTANVLVLPSVEDGFGMVMAEAMACGTPVIASHNTGGADLFEDGVEGLLVPIRDPEALCTAMLRLAEDPALQRRMRAAAYARMQSLGGWAQYGETVHRLLHQLLAERHGRPA